MGSGLRCGGPKSGQAPWVNLDGLDHALVESLAHLAHPGVDVNFGTPQAQRRFTAHGHQMVALSARLTAVFDIAHFVGVATVEHLGHQRVIVGRLITGTNAFKLVPVISKDLLEDTPVPGGLCHHRVAPSWGHEIGLVKRFYHASAASSTPHRSIAGHPLSTCLPLNHTDFWDRENALSYTIKI